MAEAPMSEPTAGRPWGEADTPYEEIGGEATVRAISETFYDIIDRDSPVLRAMLPDDTIGSRRKLYQFLTGWTGGPPLYWEEHGHPRLRMRHAPFPIDEAAAREWARAMSEAIDVVDMPERAADFLKRQLSAAALTLINR